MWECGLICGYGLTYVGMGWYMYVGMGWYVGIKRVVLFLCGVGSRV